MALPTTCVASSGVHSLSIIPQSLCTTSFSGSPVSYKWCIGNAEEALIKSSLSLETKCLGNLNDIANNFFLSIRWIRDVPDKLYPGKLSIKLTFEPIVQVLVSNFYFIILDCFSRKILKLNDVTFRAKYQIDYNRAKSYEKCSMQGDITIPENESMEHYLHNGALTIQVTATMMNLSSKQSVTKSCAIPHHEYKAKINGMYQEGLFTDLSIVAGDKTFKVHKIVLASQSDVFKRMLESDMKEKKESVVNLSDSTAPEVVEDLLAYFYTGSCPNIKKYAKELLIEADKYDIIRLKLMCENELNMNLKIETVTSVLLLADRVQQHKGSTLLQSCVQFIQKHSSSIKKSKDWTEHCNELSEDLLSKLCI